MSAPDLAAALNDFEEVLFAVIRRQRSLGELLDAMLDSEVVILLDKDPGPDDLLEGRALPLVLSNPHGQPVLAAFSAPERSVAMALEFPAFGFGLPVHFQELLKVIRPGVGLVINPGTNLGFEMPAKNVARMQQELLQG